ncbi:AraC family transcriptional regulator [Litoribacillus peritrichatus]|uniref:AraC family transcriptional regulator n=1 Tax=Litoribacillus peritrichatus TaxID=718191 RepID=A0ABP7MAJ5_9GAMM
MGSLAELMQSYVDLKSLNDFDGVTSTSIRGVHFYRDSQGNTRQPLVYQSGIIAIGQGYKRIYLGDQSVRYGAGDYVVVGVPMPLECEAFPEDGLPIMGISINVAPKTLHNLVNQLADQPLHQENEYSKSQAALNLGLKSECVNEALDECFKRLLLVLHDEVDSKVLGASIVEEIIYRVLMGKHGHVLFDLAKHDGHYARIAKVLDRLHADYANQITVESLAEQANMSLSGFHRAFRQVTTETPLQYLKKVRLNKAKELIVSEGKRASDAAILVGYTSPSQFSREFKRHFNATPKSLAG